MDTLAADLRYALRIFRRSPGFAATAVVSLAVGIAAATGLFSIVNAALLNPFPFADINRIVRLDMIDKGKPRGLSVTARQLVALQHSDVLDGAFASNTWEMTLTGQDLPEAVPTQYFSANSLNVLGVPPLIGRVFNEADGPAGEQPQRVVVLTYRFWQRHFGGQPEALGQTLSLNREPYTVIGVLPRQYFYAGPEILVPLDLTFDLNFAWSVQARLKRGVTPRMAEQRLQPLFDQFANEAPQRFPKEVRPLVRSLVETQRAADFVPTLLLIFAASLLLLLLACANVSILLLARGPCDGVGAGFWTVTGLVVFAAAPDGDCPDDRRRRKPASASPPARGSNCADGAVARGHWRGRPGAHRSVPDIAWLRSAPCDHRVDQPSREQLHEMGRPLHVLRAPTESHGRRAPSRIGRPRHLRDTTSVGRTVGGRSSRTGHDRRRGTDSSTDQRPLLCHDENPAHSRPRVVRFRERRSAPRRRRQPNDGS